MAIHIFIHRPLALRFRSFSSVRLNNGASHADHMILVSTQLGFAEQSGRGVNQPTYTSYLFTLPLLECFKVIF
jgi:hypothetical protein